MIKKSILYLIAVSISSGLIYSCVDLDVEKETLADVYITAKIINGDTLYSLESYVSSSAAMTGVSMKSPDGSNEVEFKKFTTGYYEYIVDSQLFSVQKPSVGYYSFSVAFDDETTITVTDNLTTDVLAPILIKNVSVNNETKSVNVDWKKDEDADYYTVKILKNKAIVFVSGLINADYSEFTIYSYSNGWATNANPEGGDSLDIVVSGILKEETLSQYVEIQAISQSPKTPVIWPE